MSQEPKKINRRSFLYAGLGALALIAFHRIKSAGGNTDDYNVNYLNGYDNCSRKTDNDG